MTRHELTLHHHGPDEAVTMRDALLPVYTASHAHLIGVDPWNDSHEWWTRLTKIYAGTRDFDLVTGWLGDRLAGYAFGSPTDNERLWPQLQQAFAHLDPSGAVYVFREFAVDPLVQRRGYGGLIHDELLRDRPEQVAHLLLRKDNAPARAAYLSWGWKPAGELQPFPDSQTFDAMALDLTARRG